MRQLSAAFLNDLKDEQGVLHPIFKCIQSDDTIMLAIRQDYVNVYYRGGNLLRLNEQGYGAYATSFDPNYNSVGLELPQLPSVITTQTQAAEWVSGLPQLKRIMDIYFSMNRKPEREFQQLVARENNDSTISNSSEYFIADIEFADSELGARFDMLAIKWLSKQRKNGENCRATLIEMKYGDDSLGGSSGLVKHLEDVNALVNDRSKYTALIETMESQINQLDDLGQLKFTHAKQGTKVKLSVNDKPEFIFLLANHNPRSSKLTTLLDDPIFLSHDKNDHFDLRFFVSTFAGYGMHSDCMYTLNEFQDLLHK